jgi:ppGpp synthetase/RelA/SpoT-type nucleotidyltranferase
LGVPARVDEAYEATRSRLEALAATVRDTLSRWAEDRKYLFVGRVKTVQSVAEKIETGRYERWSQLDDLYACTIVVPTASHEDGVLEFLANAFLEREVRSRKTTRKAPDVFRFDTTRFIGSLRLQPGLERPSGVEDLLFEVQIPTAFDYAWLVATHDLVYKAKVIDWRRIRLAAQLKAAVEQIDALIEDFESRADAVPTSEHDDTAVRAEIVALCQAKIGEGRLPAQLEPQSWSRFADNVVDLVRSYAPNRFAVPGAVRSLLRVLEERVDDAENPVPISGSLFQVVLGVVPAAPKANLDNFIVVQSEELAQFHGVATVPKPFVFD